MSIGALQNEADLKRWLQQELDALLGPRLQRMSSEIGSGGGGGAVDSVNGKVGVVVLEAPDVGADPKGAAASAEASAKTQVETEKSRAETAEAAKQATSEKGKPNGYAELEAAGKVPVSQLPSAIMEYQGTWNASTNTPKLEDGKGSTGDVYRVSVAGEHNFGSGSISFEVGDYAIYNGATWEKSDTTDAVASVAGKKGAVTLVVGDVAEAESTANKDTDKTLKANSATRYPSQSAVKGFVETETGLLVPKSAIDTDSTFASATDEKVPSSKAVKTALSKKLDSASLVTAVLTKAVGPIKEQETPYQEITGLGVPIGASATEVWQITYWLYIESANTTMDVKFGFTNVPAGLTGIGGGIEGNSTALAGWTGVGLGSTPPDLNAVNKEVSAIAFFGTSTTKSGVKIEVLVFGGGNAGTLQIGFAQSAKNSGNLSIIKGAMRAERLAT